MKKSKFTAVMLSAALLLTSCGLKTNDSGKLKVYTSFYAMYDFARLIGGDMADINILCSPGQEPHDFEPTAKDIAELSDADVFIYNGMGMEHWADSVITTLEDSDVLIVEASKDVAVNVENNDPHVWLNPKNAYEQMSAIADAFVTADPDNSEYYISRLEDCREKTDELINAYETEISKSASKNIVVSHDAYMHLCRAFSLTQFAVNGIDNSEDPTPTRMAEIEKFIKDNNIKYVFTEPLGTSSIVETVANDTDCEILVLDPFEGNTENKDYFTVMYENLEGLKKALN